jgi:bifunctional enzyme CysN/CysC
VDPPGEPLLKHALAVNKLDLVDYSQDVFDSIEADYRASAERVGLDDVVAIPLSALKGDNIVENSERTPWYGGPALVPHLEAVEVEYEASAGPFRMPVQWVNRPNLDFRGFSGTIAGGTVRLGDRLRVLPSGQTSSVARIVTGDGDLADAVAGQAVTICLADEIDISRGDLLADVTNAPGVADRFEAHIVWMGGHQMLPGRPYLLKLNTLTVGVTIDRPKYRINVNTLEHTAAKTLELNEIGVCNISTDRPIPFDPYTSNRDLGGFIVIDRITNTTVGAGLLHFALRRSHNVHWQALDVDAEARARLKGHGPAVVWFTGISGAGKSTIANMLEKRLHALGIHTTMLDGDNIRHGLNKDLGFTEQDRVENIRRAAEVSKLMVNAGLVVLVSFISPFRSEREMARSLVGSERFVEVFIDTPLAVAEQRDVKGLYGKARRGELPNFTGVDSPYEPPDAPEIRIDTTTVEPTAAIEQILDQLRRAQAIP